MFNAEEIIELEKKWKIYNNKRKTKFLSLVLISIVTLIFAFYYLYFLNFGNLDLYFNSKTIAKKQKTIEHKNIIIPPKLKPITKVQKKDINILTIATDKNITKSKNKIIAATDKNATNNKNKLIINTSNTNIIKKSKALLESHTKIKSTKLYYFKLEPTEQGSELFSSDGFLTLNLPFQDIKKDIKVDTKTTQQVVAPIKDISKNSVPSKKKIQISMNMQDMNTIEYLKKKYYSTSSIVFALMLAEEYYYSKDYKNSLQWALTANDIDSQNTKSWYWFAKSKVKLGNIEDAKKALKAYLSNNESKRLMTLLNKIETGDYDD